MELTGDQFKERMGHSCGAVGQKLYIFGGRDRRKRYRNKVLIIDIETGCAATACISFGHLLARDG
jgi:hypothetical protein